MKSWLLQGDLFFRSGGEHRFFFFLAFSNFENYRFIRFFETKILKCSLPKSSLNFECSLKYSRFRFFSRENNTRIIFEIFSREKYSQILFFFSIKKVVQNPLCLLKGLEQCYTIAHVHHILNSPGTAKDNHILVQNGQK